MAKGAYLSEKKIFMVWNTGDVGSSPRLMCTLCNSMYFSEIAQS